MSKPYEYEVADAADVFALKLKQCKLVGGGSLEVFYSCSRE
jgi:hypothetical protein